MKLSELIKIYNSDWINVEAEIIKAYLNRKCSVFICRSWMDDNSAIELRKQGYVVIYDQYKSRYEISGWDK